jgi:hypothetical protein
MDVFSLFERWQRAKQTSSHDTVSETLGRDPPGFRDLPSEKSPFHH